MTCQTSVSDRQFEVMPTKRKGFCLMVRAVISGINFLLEVEPSDTIESVKLKAHGFFGLPIAKFELRWRDQFLDEPEMTLAEYDIKNDAHVKMIPLIEIGPDALEATRIAIKEAEKELLTEKKAWRTQEEDEIASEMATVPGGLLKQPIMEDRVPADDWDQKNIVIFNLQLFNATDFQTTVGTLPPKTPITVSTYSQYGYRFCKDYEEPSSILGDFLAKQLEALEMNKGKKVALDGKGKKKRGFDDDDDEQEDLHVQMVDTYQKNMQELDYNYDTSDEEKEKREVEENRFIHLRSHGEHTVARFLPVADMKASLEKVDAVRDV